MAYHYPSCDLYVVGTGYGSSTNDISALISLSHSSPEIYRLNLDIGRFQSASVTEAT